MDPRPIPAWLPNAISTLRVLLVPIWLVVAERGVSASADEGAASRHALLGILVLLGFSDVLDGWLARRYGLTSRFGATLDAVADKIAQVAFVTYLVWRPHPHLEPLSLVLWATLVARDGLLAAGYVVVRRARGTVDTEHAVHGKLASVLLFFVVLAAILQSRGGTAATTWLTVPVVIWSTAAHLRSGYAQLQRGEVGGAADAE